MTTRKSDSKNEDHHKPQSGRLVPVFKALFRFNPSFRVPALFGPVPRFHEITLHLWKSHRLGGLQTGSGTTFEKQTRRTPLLSIVTSQGEHPSDKWDKSEDCLLTSALFSEMNHAKIKKKTVLSVKHREGSVMVWAALLHLKHSVFILCFILLSAVLLEPNFGLSLHRSSTAEWSKT